MNKKQLGVIWIALVLLTTMIWFPETWFGCMVEGYPAIKPESAEFLVKVLIPLTCFSLFFVYLLRDSTQLLEHAVVPKRRKKRSLVRFIFVMIVGVVVGLLVSEIRNFKVQTSEFKEFCTREGYREEVELLVHWVKKTQAAEIAILYNKDDLYSAELYKRVSKTLEGEPVKVVLSEVFTTGESSFSKKLSIIESLKPEAIIFLGTHEERIAFVEAIAHRPTVAYWEGRREKIKWIE
jgi:hypothetical protein